MLNGAWLRPNVDLIIALTQPILGLSTRIHAIAVSRPGIANERSASAWNKPPRGASVRSTTQATNPPITSGTGADPIQPVRQSRIPSPLPPRLTTRCAVGASAASLAWLEQLREPPLPAPLLLRRQQ